MAEPQLTLVSTTDSLAEVQAALGVPAVEQTPAVAVAEETKPAVLEKPAEKVVEKAAETPAVVVPPVEVKVETPATPVTDAKPKKPDNSLQGRIDELVKQRDTARGLSAVQEIELDALRNKVKELVAGQTPVVAKVETPTTEQPEPKIEDFPDYDAFVKASIQYHARKIATEQVKEALAAARTTAQTAEQQQAASVIRQEHDTRVTAARAKYSDFDEQVGRPDMPITRVMLDSIVISDLGPDVAYYLATHPEERDKLVKLGETAMAIKAFGRLEQRVEAELERASAVASQTSSPNSQASAVVAPAVEVAKPAAVVPEVVAKPVAPATQAPDPINPVSGGQVTTTVRPDQMSFGDYKRWREGQLAAKTGTR